MFVHEIQIFNSEILLYHILIIIFSCNLYTPFISDHQLNSNRYTFYFYLYADNKNNLKIKYYVGIRIIIYSLEILYYIIGRYYIYYIIRINLNLYLLFRTSIIIPNTVFHIFFAMKHITISNILYFLWNMRRVITQMTQFKNNFLGLLKFMFINHCLIIIKNYIMFVN